VAAVTRTVIVDSQPAVRAGLTVLLRGEPGFVPVGAAGSAEEAAALLDRNPHVVLLEPRLAGSDDGLKLCRRIKARIEAPLVVLYTLDPDPTTILAARVAGADGVVDKAADPSELFEALRRVARGGTALPPLSAEEFDDAARRADPEDLALLAMLVDRTSQAEVAETLRLDPRRVARRVERLLGRLRTRPAGPAAA
jgi:DNA-binding NarL/FixJ family response regulator